MHPRTVHRSIEKDPVVEFYKNGVDVTLLKQNLMRTVEERITNLMALQRFAITVREAGRKALKQ